MSGSRDKKTHLGVEPSVDNPKTAREATERTKQKKSDRMYLAIGIVFLLVAIVVVTWNSGVIQKNATAMTINGESYSAAEVSYYYKGAYNSFLNEYGSYASMFGLDTNRPLQDQPCAFSAEGGSWYDYFMDEASSSMISVSALCAAAEADGFQAEGVDAQIALALSNLTEATKNYNTTYSASYSDIQYLRLVYGSYITMNTYKEQITRQLIASAYSDSYVGTLEYSDSDLSAAYNADTNAYDAVDFEQVAFSGTAPSSADAEGNAVEPTEEEIAAAKEAAQSSAAKLHSDFLAGQSLQILSEGNESASYSNNTAGTYSESAVSTWLFDSARKSGDSAVVQGEDGSCFVLVFHSRYRHEYPTVDVRHILITPEATTFAEGDEGYEADIIAKTAVAQKIAEDLLAEFKAGAATEEAFAALATEKSADTGSAPNGGLVPDISKDSSLVTTFKDWAMADHKLGDTGIVESEYGFHIMYLSAFGDPYWKVQVENSLKNAAFSEWYTAKLEGYEAVPSSFGAKFVA